MSDENRNDDDSVEVESALKVGDNVFVRPESEVGCIEMVEETRRGCIFHVKMYNGSYSVKKYNSQLCYTTEVPNVMNSAVSNEYRRTRQLPSINTTFVESNPPRENVPVLVEEEYFVNSNENRQINSTRKKGSKRSRSSRTIQEEEDSSSSSSSSDEDDTADAEEDAAAPIRGVSWTHVAGIFAFSIFVPVPIYISY